MSHQLILIVAQYGLLVVSLTVLVDQLGIPVPAYPALIVAGAFAGRGGLGLLPLFLLSVGACLAADSAWYWLGGRYGIRVLRTLCRISLEPDSCVSQTQTRFETWGVSALLIAKFVPGLSIIAPPLAGAMRIGWIRFLALSTGGAVLWAGSGLVVGVLFAPQIDAVFGYLQRVGRIAAAALVVSLSLYLLYKAFDRARFLRHLRMARISVSDLYELMQAGTAPIIIDTRSVTARALEPRIIPTAIHVPLKDVAQRVRELPTDRDIVVYCACPNEASAAQVAKILMSHGLKKVRPLSGGLDAWIAAGYLVDSPVISVAGPSAEKPQDAAEKSTIPVPSALD
jgi:membrane protein DedA with SNARE-associated domain/rhodanese-related sulfurtransferase